MIDYVPPQNFCGMSRILNSSPKHFDPTIAKESTLEREFFCSSPNIQNYDLDNYVIDSDLAKNLYTTELPKNGSLLDNAIQTSHIFLKKKCVSHLSKKPIDPKYFK